MASWITPTIHATGDVLSVTDWNAVANDVIFSYQAPYARYYNSVATSITSSLVATQVTLGGTSFSNYGFSISSNNAVIPLTGMYWVAGQVSLSASGGSGTDYMSAQIYQNGAANIYGSTCPTASAEFPGSQAAGLLQCSAAATIGLYCSQNSGSAITTNTSAANTSISLAFLGSQ